MLTISLHRYDNQTFWPFRQDAQPSYVGRDKGKGFNVNIAWQTGCNSDEDQIENNELTDLGNNEYRYACENLLLPIAKEFAPDLILIACGFDSGLHDPLGWSQVTPMMYYWMTQ